MRKLRSDANWHKLTPEQQQKIEHWFFTENLSYRAVRERMRTELGLNCALSTIGPMCHRCNELRSHEREPMLDRLTEILVELRADLRRIPKDSLTVISSHLMHRAAERNDSKAVSDLAGVALELEAQDIQRDRTRLREEKLALRRLEFAAANGAIGPKEIAPKLDGNFRKVQAELARIIRNGQAESSGTVPPQPGLSGINRDKK